MAGGPGPVALRQVPPRRAGVAAPDAAVENRSVVVVGATGPGTLGGQQRREAGELVIGELMSSDHVTPPRIPLASTP